VSDTSSLKYTFGGEIKAEQVEHYPGNGR